jgi:hypothetical protein
MIDIPRGQYLGKPLGDPPGGEAGHSSAAPAAADGSTAAILLRYSSTKGRCRTRRRINRNDRRSVRSA